MLDFDSSITPSDDYYSTFTPPRIKKAKKIIFPVSSSLDPITIGAKRPNADDVKIIGGRGYDLRQPIPVKYV